MKFMLVFEWGPDTEVRKEGIKRFLDTGGQPPAGIQLLGRWTRADLSGGYVLFQCEDPKAITEFALMWGDLMEVSIGPVIEDQELVDVLKRAGY